MPCRSLRREDRPSGPLAPTGRSRQTCTAQFAVDWSCGWPSVCLLDCDCWGRQRAGGARPGRHSPGRAPPLSRRGRVSGIETELVQGDRRQVLFLAAIGLNPRIRPPRVKVPGEVDALALALLPLVQPLLL